MVIDGTNRHDTKMPAATIEAIVVERPAPSEGAPQHLCLDKAYDNPTGHEAVERFGYIGHIQTIGEEQLDEEQEKTYPARRWVVERTLSWLSKCRGPLVRYEKKSKNFLAMLQLACGLLWYRHLYRLKRVLR